MIHDFVFNALFFALGYFTLYLRQIEKKKQRERLEVGLYTPKSPSPTEVYQRTKNLLSDNIVSPLEMKKFVSETNPSGFVVGDVVFRKKGTYLFHSTVQVIFQNRAGVWNLVCESHHDPGLLHIFTAESMEKWHE